MFKKDKVIDLEPVSAEDPNSYHKEETSGKEKEEEAKMEQDKSAGTNELLIFGGMLIKKVAPILLKGNPKVARAVGLVAEGVSQSLVKERIGNRAISNQVIENSITSLDGMLDSLKSEDK